MSEDASSFARALAALAESGVEFVIVGVGGINFYARTPARAFATLDLDALLAPTVDNLQGALRALAGLGFAFEAGGEPFLELDDADILARVVTRGVNLSAIHPEGGQIDLMTSIAGFEYRELASDATAFLVAGAEVRVGRLDKLLASKQASGRRKDLEFLRAFEAQEADDDDCG